MRSLLLVLLLSASASTQAEVLTLTLKAKNNYIYKIEVVALIKRLQPPGRILKIKRVSNIRFTATYLQKSGEFDKIFVN